jgi:hypothetical protein
MRTSATATTFGKEIGYSAARDMGRRLLGRIKRREW